MCKDTESGEKHCSSYSRPEVALHSLTPKVEVEDKDVLEVAAR